MKERPILFSGEMVRAVLDGRKTQTRRVMKNAGQVLSTAYKDSVLNIKVGNRYISCPYGQSGDRLWVRETFKYTHFSKGYDNGIQQGGDHDFAFGFAQVEYKDEVKKIINELDEDDVNIKKPVIDKWYPSIHMPRWASRINLEITGVRVERLLDITRDDAIKEGHSGEEYPLVWYSDLWDKINGPGSWNLNPWVWVIEFKKI